MTLENFCRSRNCKYYYIHKDKQYCGCKFFGPWDEQDWYKDSIVFDMTFDEENCHFFEHWKILKDLDEL